MIITYSLCNTKYINYVIQLLTMGLRQGKKFRYNVLFYSYNCHNAF